MKICMWAYSLYVFDNGKNGIQSISRIYKTSQESSEWKVILFLGHRSFPVSSPS